MRCGEPGHHPDKCFFKDQECKACKKRGHLAKMCRTQLNSKQQHTLERKTAERKQATNQLIWWSRSRTAKGVTLKN